MPLDERSKHLRRLAIRCLRGGNRGHIGSTMSLIEIMRVLYDRFPEDTVILSKGHGCIAQYVMLADKGIIPMEELDHFCRKDGMLGGHPAPHIPGVHCHTGSLGHGLSIAIGMALADRIKGETRRYFVVMGDGEINEGSVWEAAMSTSKHKLDNLTVVIDYNRIQSAGKIIDIQPLEPLVSKWEAFGFYTYECDGHNVNALGDMLGFCHTGHPVCIIAYTTKGKGIPFAENDPTWHHKAFLSEEQFKEMETALE